MGESKLHNKKTRNILFAILLVLVLGVGIYAALRPELFTASALNDRLRRIILTRPRGTPVTNYTILPLRLPLPPSTTGGSTSTTGATGTTGTTQTPPASACGNKIIETQNGEECDWGVDNALCAKCKIIRQSIAYGPYESGTYLPYSSLIKGEGTTGWSSSYIPEPHASGGRAVYEFRFPLPTGFTVATPPTATITVTDVSGNVSNVNQSQFSVSNRKNPGTGNDMPNIFSLPYEYWKCTPEGDPYCIPARSPSCASSPLGCSTTDWTCMPNNVPPCASATCPPNDLLPCDPPQNYTSIPPINTPVGDVTIVVTPQGGFKEKPDELISKYFNSVTYRSKVVWGATDEDVDGDRIPYVYASTNPVCANGQTTGCKDNCPYKFNPDQKDSNGDKKGDACS